MSHLRHFFGNVTRTKPVVRTVSNAEFRSLPPTLHMWHLVPLGVGSTIGAGVYILVGTAAREHSGPALPISFLIAGASAAVSALCYAELSSRFPSAGSAYHYSYATLGEGLAWMIGWALILEYTLSGAAVARGISPNLMVFMRWFPINLDAWLARIPVPSLGLELDPCAGMSVAVVTLLLCQGAKESALFQSVFTALNVLMLVLVVIAGAYLGFVADWPGYNQEEGYFPFGMNGVLAGAASVFFSFVGFDAVASTAEEVFCPQRSIPLGIFLSLGICLVLYVAVSAVMVGLLPFRSIQGDTPLVQMFSASHMSWARFAASVGALSAMCTTLLGSLLPQPRILLAMSRDGLLPPFFAKINSKLVPGNASLVTGLLAGSLALTLDITELSAMVSVGTLLAFTASSLSLLVVRFVPLPTSSETECSSAHGSVDTDTTIHKWESSSQSTFSDHAAKDHHTAVFQAHSSDGWWWFQGPGQRAVQSPQTNEQMPPGGVPSVCLGSADSLPQAQEAGPEFGSLDEGLSSGRIQSKREGQLEEALLAGHRHSDYYCGRKHALRTIISPVWCLVSVAMGAPMFCWSTSTALLSSADDLPVNTANSFLFGLGSTLSLVGCVGLFLQEQTAAAQSFRLMGGFFCPWVPALPLCSIFANVYLLVNLGWSAGMRSFWWMLAGVLVYFLYGSKKNSPTA